MMKETSYELLKDDQNMQLNKNNKANMTLYNALSRKEYERVFMCKTAKEIKTIRAKSCEKVSSCSSIKMESKGGESLRKKGVFYNFGVEGHFASECTKPKENKAFVGRAWSNSEDGDKPQNDATCLMAIDSQEVQTKPSIYNNDLDIIDLQK
ncbi:hypothetical protein Tco_1527350 [Tanacetum coccineum]